MIAETAPVSSQGVAPHLIAWTGAVLLIQLVQKWLKEGYQRAREIVQEDEFMSGASQGFVMGLLDWEWHTVVIRFGRFRHFQIYKMDEGLNYIRVHAYNRGLAAGYSRGKAMSAEEKKAWLKEIRRLAGVHGNPAGWKASSGDTLERQRAQRVQINYVIDLAAAVRKHGIE